MNTISHDAREDLLALTTHTAHKAHWSRRDFMAGSIATSVASGFALAAQPVCAQTVVHTDARHLAAQMVQIPTENGMIPAYCAMPSPLRPPPLSDASLPIMVVVQEIFGVHEHIQDVCRRFALQGYLAIAPALFHRQGDASKLKDNKEIFEHIVAKVADWQVMRDIDATVRWADRNGGTRHKLGITGFCWGGRIAWLYPAHNDYVKASVAWYGRLTGEKTLLTPLHPIDVTDNIRVPVLGLYGATDAGIPVKDVEQMRATLGKKLFSASSAVHLYPDTPHAFFADYRPSYREKEAADAWDRCLAWFKKSGVAA
jgi:carboxymethylenebutenolidase